MTQKFDGWPSKTSGHLSYAKLSLVHHFKAIGEFKLKLQSGNAQFRSKSANFCPVWPWNLTDDIEIQNRATLLCCFKLSVSFRSNWWIQTGVRKRQIWVKIDVFYPCDLEIWRMTLKNNRAPLLSNTKLCASFHHHMWIKIRVTVKLGFDLCDLDLWPWPFAWTSLWSLVITPENFMMIRWWEHGKRAWQADRRTELTIHRAAWSQLKSSVTLTP